MSSAGGIILPRVEFPADNPVAPAQTLNRTARPASETQLTVPAQNAPLRIIYGRCRIGAQIANVVPWGNYWVIQAVWGEGEVNAVELVEFNDEAVPAGVIQTHYTGTAGQTVDATLVAAFAANGFTYTDALANIAYSVFKVPADADNGFPQIAAIIQGRKVRNPGSATAYSTNPALCLADFLESTPYGLGRTVDDTSLTAARDACDATVGGSARRAFGLVLDSVQPVESWVDTLRTYAACWVATEGSTVRLVPDRPRATDASFTHASGQIQKIGNLKKRGVVQAPTALELRYTDTTQSPWRDESVWVYAAGVLAGTTARRDSQVALPGIQNASQATREATERLNKLLLADLSFSLEVFDEGAKLQLGDVIEVTHPIGLTAKPMRVVGISGNYGRYSLDLIEYDPAVYSDAIVGAPTYPDTSLPSPAAPPALASVTASEEIYQQQDGTYSSRIRLTWSAPANFPYPVRYSVTVSQAGTVIDQRAVDGTSYASPSVQEGLLYVSTVAVVSSTGAVSAATQANNLTAIGKYLPPGPVPAGSLSGFEAGGMVYLAWGAANDIDIWRYRLKYGTTSQTYAQATTLDLVDALRYQAKTVPTGTWRFWVESVDSVRNESGTPRYVDIVVTLDNNAFLVSNVDQTAPTLSNMSEYALNRTDGIRRFVSDDARTWNAQFTAAMNTYSNPVYAYFATLAASWTGESEDFGQDLGGDWKGTATVSALAGSVASEVQLAMAATPTTWVGYGALTAKANGRFARLKHTAAAGNSLYCEIPTQNIRLDAVPREEVVTGTSSAAGPVTVTLTNTYAKAKKITVAVQSTTAAIGVYDNVVIGSPTRVDVYVFDTAGTKIAKPFTLIFQGV